MHAQDAQTLLNQLQTDLDDGRLTQTERRVLLERLKVIGRNPSNAAPIFVPNSILLLCRYGLDSGRNEASREALRCLSNAMLLNEPARQHFVDLGYAGKAAELMKNDNRDDEFLSSRALFFATYTNSLDIATLIERHGLASTIKENLSNLAKQSSGGTSTPVAVMAHQETVKLIPNLIYHHKPSAKALAPAINPLVQLLLRSPPQLAPPTTLYINALLNLLPPSSTSRISDLDPFEPLFPSSDPSLLSNHLITLLAENLPATLTTDSDARLAPLLSLLRALYSASARLDLQQSIQSALLPSSADRSVPLGKSTSLPSRLLQATTSPIAPHTRDVASALLFELSDSNPQTLTNAIGYGYAVGILTRLGVEAPVLPASSPNGSTSTTGTSKTKDNTRPSASTDAAGEVNPVTGQTLHAELEARMTAAREWAANGEVDLDEMTEEEKEREAERLFVLFERLKATGVMDVKNPVELAKEQGRLEEID